MCSFLKKSKVEKKIIFFGPELLNCMVWLSIFPSGLDRDLQNHLIVLGIEKVCLYLLTESDKSAFSFPNPCFSSVISVIHRNWDEVKTCMGP